MDLNKKINRYVNKHSKGGSFKVMKQFLKMIDEAEKTNTSIVINIDSPALGSIISFKKF